MIEFVCPNCGSKQFTLVKKRYTEVDFSQEGAVEGHPFLHSTREEFNSFICAKCGGVIHEEQSQEMLREVL